MKIPEVKNAEKYVGLYIVDFEDHCGLGFTAGEVAELLESEEFKDVTVYKIHNAYPDGKMELKGVPRETFQLESAIFFHAADQTTATDDYLRLLALAEKNAPPSRAKIQLAQFENGDYLTAVIYPAEYDEAFSKWLLDSDYKTIGHAEGGISSLQSYYDSNPEILQSKQLFSQSSYESRTGQELLAATKIAVQR